MPDDLVDLAEFATMAGVRHTTMVTYRHRGLLPKPHRFFGRNPVWLRQDAERWILDRRGPGNPTWKRKVVDPRVPWGAKSLGN